MLKFITGRLDRAHLGRMLTSGSFLLALAWAATAAPLTAAELRVDPSGETGPYKTIRQAIAAAQPGDVILLTPMDKPYLESAVFHGKAGLPGQPIILDGQGATLDGSEPLAPAEWEQVQPGLYRSTAFPVRLGLQKSILGRYYFVFDGKINRMGRVSKGGMRAPFKAPEALQPGEWTYTENEQEKTFYVCIDPAKPLESVRAPIRSNGVSMNGRCENLIVRNLTATHVWNDGFNIHEYSRNVTFENVKAIECGDDGISAHEDCQIFVRGMLSQGNSTGFCHVGQSRSDSQNMIIRDCPGMGVYLVDESQHVLRDSVVEVSTAQALVVRAKSTLQISNVRLVGSDDARKVGVLVEKQGTLDAKNLTTWNLPWTIRDGSCRLVNSVVAGPHARLTIESTATWEASNNRWSVPSFVWKGQPFTADNFTLYQQGSAQDKDSAMVNLDRQQTLRPAEAGAPGAAVKE